MILLTLFFLLGLSPTTEACLVIRYSVPPKCECSFMAVSDAKFLEHIPFILQNITNETPTTAPIIKNEDCSINMHCEGKYSLVVATGGDNVFMFGEYAAEGICEPFSQKWQVDDGTGFNTYDRLFGICVDYSEPDCPCQIDVITSTEQARELIGWHEVMRPGNNLSYEIAPPIHYEGECLNAGPYLECGPNLVPIVFTEGLTDPKYSLLCNIETKLWRLLTAFSWATEVQFAYMACINSALPAPTPKPEVACHCQSPQVDIDLSHKNQLLRGNYSLDSCLWQIHCKSPGKAQISLQKHGLYSSDNIYGKCDKESSLWRIETKENKVWENVATFNFSCVVN